MIAREGVAISLAQVAVVVAQVERERLVGEGDTGIPVPIACPGNTVRVRRAAGKKPPRHRLSGGAIEIVAGAERPVTDVTGDQHADAAQEPALEPAAWRGEGDIPRRVPAIRARVEDIR